MVDPRLNSVHLESARRQAYRQARDLLLQARGDQTVRVERQQDSHDTGAGFPTVIDKQAEDAPVETDFYLTDRKGVCPLKVGINTVGRSSENDVVVNDAFVSRRHCTILVHHSTLCELYDTASMNGTFLNGKKLSGPTRLRSGDEIRVSDQIFVFVSKHDAPTLVTPTQILPE